MSETALPLPILTSRFEDALRYAAIVHGTQRRKDTEIPYVAHLLAVTALVLEHGGDEDQAIAALLHDAAEDQGGRERLRDIEIRFGPRVAAIVSDCTDTFEDPKPEWEERKQRYLAHLPQASPASHLVSLADKVHNTRSILFDYRLRGEVVWKRFKGSREGTLWYYRTLADTYAGLVAADLQPLADELRRTIATLDAEIARRTGG